MTPIAHCLWLAANKRLWSGDMLDRNGQTKQFSCQFSCHAVISLEHEFETLDFLTRLGWKREGDQFLRFKFGPIRQGARYLALDFARLVAEDERI